MPRDYSTDPEFLAWKQDMEDRLAPMIRDSRVVISICPPFGRTDAKFAVELGLAIMLDKPIIVAVPPGTRVPDHLVRVADEIVEIDKEMEDTSQVRLQEAMQRLLPDEG